MRSKLLRHAKGSGGATDASITGNSFFGGTGGGYAYNNREPGVWTVSHVAAPVPLAAAARLLLSGLSGPGMLGRKRAARENDPATRGGEGGDSRIVGLRQIARLGLCP
jgi:hypothetical protein